MKPVRVIRFYSKGKNLKTFLFYVNTCYYASSICRWSILDYEIGNIYRIHRVADLKNRLQDKCMLMTTKMAVIQSSCEKGKRAVAAGVFVGR